MALVDETAVSDSDATPGTLDNPEASPTRLVAVMIPQVILPLAYMVAAVPTQNQ